MTMDEALITGIVAIIVCVINNWVQSRKTVTLIEYRLKQLENKVDKHNHFNERLQDIEKTREVFNEKLKVVNHRIDDLEEQGKQ